MIFNEQDWLIRIEALKKSLYFWKPNFVGISYIYSGSEFFIDVFICKCFEFP